MNTNFILSAATADAAARMAARAPRLKMVQAAPIALAKPQVKCCGCGHMADEDACGGVEDFKGLHCPACVVRIEDERQYAIEKSNQD